MHLGSEECVGVQKVQRGCIGGAHWLGAHRLHIGKRCIGKGCIGAHFG